MYAIRSYYEVPPVRRHAMKDLADGFYAALREAGMAEVPSGFSVALAHQEIPREILAGLDGFVRVFESYNFV